jgi:hypothetical protein
MNEEFVISQFIEEIAEEQMRKHILESRLITLVVQRLTQQPCRRGLNT